MFKVIILVCMIGMLAGCVNVSKKEYYENGQVKSEYTREGFVEWSDGNGKVLNMPLSNPSVVGK